MIFAMASTESSNPEKVVQNKELCMSEDTPLASNRNQCANLMHDIGLPSMVGVVPSMVGVVPTSVLTACTTLG